MALIGSYSDKDKLSPLTNTIIYFNISIIRSAFFADPSRPRLGTVPYKVRSQYLEILSTRSAVCFSISRDITLRSIWHCNVLSLQSVRTYIGMHVPEIGGGGTVRDEYLIFSLVLVLVHTSPYVLCRQQVVVQQRT